MTNLEQLARTIWRARHSTADAMPDYAREEARASEQNREDKCWHAYASLAQAILDAGWRRREDVLPHIGWLKQFLAAMDEDNWRDMRLRAERQTEEFERSLSHWEG